MDVSDLPKLETFNQYTTVYIDPSKLDDFWKAFTPVFEKTSAAPECLYFEVFEYPAEPGKITWVVNWNASVEWVMTEHLSKDYYKPYLEATEPLFTKPREVRIFKREKPFTTGQKANFERGIGDNNQGVSLHVSIELKPECIEQFWEEWRKVYPTVAAEPECLYFEMLSDPSSPGKLTWFENWTGDADWFMQVQLAKDYYKPYLAATEPMFAGPRTFALIKRKAGFVAWKEANFEGAEVGELRG